MNSPEELSDSFDELTTQQRESLLGQIKDMDFFLSMVSVRLRNLSAEMTNFGICSSDIDEILNICSSLKQVLEQLEAHISHVKRYNQQSIKDVGRAHRTLDYLTYATRVIVHDVIYTDEIDQYTYLRALMVLNATMETRFDAPGWMDDCSCQRRLLECKEMLLVSCNDEYALAPLIGMS